MTRRDDERIAATRRRVIELLSEEGHILPGGVVERMMRCGKPTCRCGTDPVQLHGP
ncbi:MAG: DUF6788 family protein, partial [Acidimicrobiales bacterium]